MRLRLAIAAVLTILVVGAAVLVVVLMTRPDALDDRRSDASEDQLSRCEKLESGSDAQRKCAKNAFVALQAEFLAAKSPPDARQLEQFGRVNQAILLALKPGQVAKDVLPLDPGIVTTGWTLEPPLGEPRRLDRATVNTFARHWWGHTRRLVITRDGRGREVVNSGCCYPLVRLELRLLHVRGTTENAVATFSVTFAWVDRLFARRKGRPQVGQVGTLRLRRGIVTDELTEVIFCADDVPTTFATNVWCGL